VGGRAQRATSEDNMCTKYLYAAVLLASFATVPTAVLAHHPGIGGVGGAGGITTIGAGTMEQGEFGMALFIEYTRLKQLSDATLLANIGHDVHGLQSVESRVLALAYGVTNDFTVSMRLPFVRRTGILEGVQDDPSDPPTIANRGNTSGFGDIAVLGQYRFLNNLASETQAALLFGFKAPTGRTNLVDPFGETFEAEFQPGSGSWDGFLGAAFSQRLAPLWAFHANVLGVLTGTGTQDTNLGNRFLYNAALVYRVFGETANEPHSHDARAAYAHAGPHPGGMVTKAPAATAPHSHVALDAVLELNGEWHDKQRTAGVVDPNSGGNTMYLAPGLRLTVDNWSGYVSAGIPVVKEVNGIQPTPSWRVVAGFAMSFGH
jgi:hypothetical protein